MKLLVLAPQPFFQNRGTPIATLKMLHVLTREGHSVDLLTFHEGEPVHVEACRHYRIARLPFIHNVPPGFSVRKLVCDVVMTWSALRLCLRKEYDLVHAVEESVFIAMVIRLLFGIPYVYDMDSSLPSQLEDRFPLLRSLSSPLRWFERQAIVYSQGVVAVCQSLEEVAASHSTTVPVVRIEDASLLIKEGKPNVKPSVHDSMPPSFDGPTLMYVGNLQSYQGIDLLLDAFVHVHYRAPRAHLIIVGGSDEDVTKYRRRAKVIGVGSHTHFIGPRPIEQLGELLDRADILVSPRTQGTNTPMKIFSYLESGKPVLATRLAIAYSGFG